MAESTRHCERYECVECGEDLDERFRFFLVFDGAGADNHDAARAYFCGVTCLSNGAGKLRAVGADALTRRNAARP